MIEIIRTDSDNSDFKKLVQQLDAELAARDGDEHAFYDQFNSLKEIKHTVVVYENDAPIACGAIKEFGLGIMEIKRMYTIPESRGKGIAGTVLTQLEFWAAELNYEKCILETGIKQPEAIALYKKSGYSSIPNYGQYAGVANSLCFVKEIKTT